MLMKPQSETVFKIHSIRHYGQPKLPKPKELRGIKQSFSIPHNPKCKCQVFIKGDDVWVKHRDYFSPSLVKPEDYGKPLGQLYDKYMGKDKSQKFVYEDAWGDIIARSEAWIKLEGLLVDAKRGVFQLNVLANTLRQQERLHNMHEFELCCTYMERFWENVIRRIYSEKGR